MHSQTGTPVLSTSFPGGQLGEYEWISPNHLRATIYREWDHEHFNTQSTWYYFRLDGVRDIPLTIEITGIKDRYNGRWGTSITHRCRPVWSSDNQNWQRLMTAHYEEGILTIQITPETDTIWIAHIEPYTEEHLYQLWSDCRHSAHLYTESAGRTVGGRDIPLWTITDGTVPDSGKSVIWLMARQHAWESHTSYCMDGFVRFVLSDDPLAAEIRRRTLVRMLPLMDPDGVQRGGTRMNAYGYDLNRHWKGLDPDDPDTVKKMPEITAAKRVIRDWLKSGRPIDLFLTFHDCDNDILYVPTAILEDAKLQQLCDLMREFKFSTHGLTPSTNENEVAVALNDEYQIRAGLVELGSNDLPTYGRYVTAADRVQFGKDLAKALHQVFNS